MPKLTLKMNEPLNRVDDNRYRERDKKDAVEKGSQDFSPLPAVSEQVGLGTLGDAYRVQRYDECQDIAMESVVGP